MSMENILNKFWQHCFLVIFFFIFQGEKGEVGMQGKDGNASMKVFLICISFYKKNF